VAEELGALDVPERLKQPLSQLKNMDLNSLGHYIRPALAIVGKSDPTWVSYWVADRILDGSLWSDGWVNLITTIPDQLKRKLLETVGSYELQAGGLRNIIPVLIAIADVSLAEKLFEKLFDLHREASDLSSEPKINNRSIVLQLEKLLLSLPPNIAVAGLSNYLGRGPEAVEFSALTELFSRTDGDGPDLRSELTEELRHRLRAYLKNGIPLVLAQDDFNGQSKAYLATALARVGEPDDIVELRLLIRADIERIKKGRMARVRREVGPLAQGAGNCWAHWHVRALTILDPRAAEETLLELLYEPEWDRYEIEAATALVRLATTSVPEQFAHRTDYRLVWAARAGNPRTRFDEERRRRYSNAISGRISTLQSERPNSPSTYDGRLKELAKLLAALDARGSSELVLKVMALPGEWDSSIRVKALEVLLLSGAELPTERTLEILNPAIEQIRAQGISDHNSAWLLVRCLCLLPFVDAPNVGIARIRQVLAETNLSPSALRDLLGALGASRSGEALPQLLEVAGPDGNSEAKVSADWINAVATLDIPDSRRVLMRFIEPEDGGLELWDIEHDYGEGEALASSIADLGSKDNSDKASIFQLCAEELPTEKRLFLSKVIARLGTTDAVFAGLNLIDDNQNPSVPYDLLKAIENVFLERLPYRTTGSYILVSRSSNEIRAKLFEMSVTDVRRKQTAFSILGQIEVWRLEHGRPSTEPRHPAFDSLEPWPPTEGRS
jgi:NACHT conflict system protein